MEGFEYIIREAIDIYAYSRSENKNIDLMSSYVREDLSEFVSKFIEENIEEYKKKKCNNNCKCKNK